MIACGSLLTYMDHLLMGFPTSTFGSLRIQLYRDTGRAFDDRDRTRRAEPDCRRRRRPG